jgi:GT2 family glycosyltransferase
MIVIVTHNGASFLVDLLSDIKGFEISNDKICIVDNKSDSDFHLSYLNSLEKSGYIILHNPEATYEIGAFKYAFENIKDSIYFFIQDSIRIKRNIFKEVSPLLTIDNVYTFLTFPCGIHDHDPKDHSELIKEYGTDQYSRGLFGNMFFALSEVVEKVKDDWKIPRTKLGSTTGERALGIVFDRHNIKIIGLAELDCKIHGNYPFFTKISALRQ